jgi:nucleoside-diphosphate-sugar epimerase
MNNTTNKDLEYIYEKTNHLLSEFSGKTIFITGGTGFIGKSMLDYFIYINQQKSIEFKLIILSRNPVNFLKKYPKYDIAIFEFVKGDIITFDFNVLPKADLIIHAATDADAKLNNEQPLLMIDTIVEGTRNILDYAVRTKAAKVLYLSSGAIYGVQPYNMIGFTEDYTGGPDIRTTASAYSEAKRLAEQYCICYKKQYKLDISIARCFAFVGPYLPLDMHFAIGNFINNGLKGEDIIIKGNGVPLRSYMYSADLIVWLLYVLVKGESGAAYNVGSDVSFSIHEIANEVAKNFPSVSVQVIGQVNPTDRNQNYVPNVGKIKNDLQVPNILGLSESIERTIKFHKE